MAEGLASATAQSLLNALFNQTNYTAPTAIWMQLHTGAPGSAGTSNVAGNTTRKDVTAVFSTASGGTVTNDVAVTWTSVSTSEDYTHYGIFTASSAGTFLWSGTITANPVTAGDTFTLAIGDIDASITTAS